MALSLPFVIFNAVVIRRAGKEGQQSRQDTLFFIHIPFFWTVRACHLGYHREIGILAPQKSARRAFNHFPFTTLELDLWETIKMLHDETSLSYRPTYTRDQLALYVSCIAPDSSYTLVSLEAEIKADPLAALSRLQLRQMAFNPWGNVALHVRPENPPPCIQLCVVRRGTSF